MENIRAILEERKFSSAVSDERITKFLEEATASTSPITVSLLEGIAPQHPAPETVSWEEIPVPAELASVAAAVLDKAPKPEITRPIQEKIKKTREVTVKAKRPFGQPKTETVEYTETVTREEKVYINPELLTSGFVRQGERLGEVQPQDMGLPGKSVRGTIIPIKHLADPFFYHGTGIARNGQVLTANETGFVRIGRNWVDIVPFRNHEWDVNISTNRATVFLDLKTGSSEAPVPGGTDVLRAVEEHHYPLDSLLSADEINTMIADAIRAGNDLERVPLSTSRDASVDIVVSDDKLSAVLNIHKGKGRGKVVSLKDVGTAIKNSGLKNLNFDTIRTDISAFFHGPEFDLTGYVLCEGTPPTPAPDRGMAIGITFHPSAVTEAMKNRLETLYAEHLKSGSECVESMSEFTPQSIQKTAEVTADTLLLTIEPESSGENGVNVFGAQIAAPAGAVPELKLFENVLLKNNLVVTTADGVLDYAEIDGTHFLRVRSHSDAEIEVSVSPDRKQAWLTMTDGTGSGTRLTRETVDAAIEAAGVQFGLNEEVISKALLAANAGTPIGNLVFARATEPVDQSDHQVEWAIDFAGGQNVRIRKDGTADFKSRNSITSVAAGQILCRILPAEDEAQDGTDVQGNPIAAKVTTGTPIEIGPNVAREEDAEGGAVLRAQTAGEIIYEKNRLEIKTIHTIKGDVDMSVGNVKFSGTVEIGGTVRSGFYVVSGGDIKIGGGVEGALLSSDGDILVKLGVKGAGKAVLRSKKNILTTFIELATVLSVGDLVLKSALVRSRVKCNGTLHFQGDKGRIVGGTVRSKNGLSVQRVGSERGIKTQISFGQNYLISDLIESEEKEITKVKKRIAQIDLEMRGAQRTGAAAVMEKARAEKIKLLKLLEKRGLRLFTLRERFEEHYPSKVIVKESAYAGTVFESHGRTYELTTTKKGIQVEFDPRTGTISITDLKGGS